MSGSSRSWPSLPPPITLPARAVANRTGPSLKKLCRHDVTTSSVPALELL